ncbi:MAG: LPS assembly lipoprotein LptE [Proteobacteria bacterium]|nr:LPS assembly lipoprotein LptE [Pseudomonadota bacterium]MCL2308515.1 LPS assembly lipoprotein LptE [Pseudomonadota bacterium]
MWSSENRLQRRALLRGALWLGVAGTLSACGFKLRGQVAYTFQSIAINGGEAPGLTEDLCKLLDRVSGLKVMPHPKDAQVTLDLKQQTDDKAVLSLTSGGRAREYSLTKIYAFRLYDKDGNDWMLPGEIEIQRTYLYDDTQRLAREIQEQRILQEMQQDAAQQILRRLQKAQRPG